MIGWIVQSEEVDTSSTQRLRDYVVALLMANLKFCAMQPNSMPPAFFRRSGFFAMTRECIRRICDYLAFLLSGVSGACLAATQLDVPISIPRLHPSTINGKGSIRTILICEIQIKSARCSSGYKLCVYLHRLRAFAATVAFESGSPRCSSPQLRSSLSLVVVPVLVSVCSNCIGCSGCTSVPPHEIPPYRTTFVACLIPVVPGSLRECLREQLSLIRMGRGGGGKTRINAKQVPGIR
ncbi:hypothetical protein C8R45DRAFT_948156 [Mycena sanguinolenta]|nr:hypothetical protein C8R45DRAFT_948156 [Mycena sanguinolenta]